MPGYRGKGARKKGAGRDQNRRPILLLPDINSGTAISLLTSIHHQPIQLSMILMAIGM